MPITSHPLGITRLNGDATLHIAIVGWRLLHLRRSVLHRRDGSLSQPSYSLHVLDMLSVGIDFGETTSFIARILRIKR
jgi:hypothetical protein